MKTSRSGIIYPILFFILLLAQVCAQAATIEYLLSIGVEQINITGTSVKAMTINGSIPGPTLRFTEGDIARIHVRNTMNVETSIHWHGLLVPPDMDGVPNITFSPIKSGEVFICEFPIRQHGTYWYHSHTELQEQRELYGSIVIEPQMVTRQVDRDHVVLLSDWTDENPQQVLRTLKRGSEWYALEKGSAQSIFGAARLGMLGDYFKRELQRMPPMDIADVAYDCFLANGQAETTLSAFAGETVRLRIINGSATTYFYLEFAGGPMTIIAVDGQNVEPLEEKRFFITVAETYDVLVQMPESGSHELRATAHDGSSFSSVWLGSGHRTSAPDIPKPNLYHFMGGLKLGQVFALTPACTMGMEDKKVDAGHFDTPGMMGMDHMDMTGMHSMRGMEHKTEQSSMSGMDHGGHAMKSSPGISFAGKKYGDDFGFMAADVVASPSLTMSTTIEFDANEVGDWFFHCHLLYHMKSGMARGVHYNNFTPAPESRCYRNSRQWFRPGLQRI